MKILIMGDKKRYDCYSAGNPVKEHSQVIFVPRDADEATVLAHGKDADALLVDAVSRVPAELIRQMPRLKLIHSEGVAYNAIDCAEAKRQGIYVCNNKGANASAVAEQAVYLMLALLRRGVEGDRLVREGKQMQTKEAWMVSGIKELPDCKIGLVGFGDIAKATAKLLKGFGCELYYYNRHRQSEKTEQEYGVTYQSLTELAETCDIISLHLAVTAETTGIVNAEFLSRMKRDAYLVNTSRGELVDNEALREAIVEERIAGAGLDTVAPEPVTPDNLLLHLPEPYRDRITFSPHIGGVTRSSFYRMHRFIWSNVARLEQGERPLNIVNGL